MSAKAMNKSVEQYEFGFTREVEKPLVGGGCRTERGAIITFDGRKMNRYEAWLAFHAPMNGGAL
jgi:hypothetical protein